MQSVNWEFDITAFRPPDLTNEYIAGEVKATTRELDKFLANLQRCCDAGEHELESNAAQANAHKKWRGLVRSRAPVFWAVGPGGDSLVFHVSYRADGRITLKRAIDRSLQFNSNAMLQLSPRRAQEPLS